jgi:hypothetical protein
MLRVCRLVKIYRFWEFLDRTERHTNYPNLFRLVSLVHYLLGQHSFTTFQLQNFPVSFSNKQKIKEIGRDKMAGFSEFFSDCFYLQPQNLNVSLKENLYK